MFAGSRSFKIKTEKQDSNEMINVFAVDGDRWNIEYILRCGFAIIESLLSVSFQSEENVEDFV